MASSILDSVRGKRNVNGTIRNIESTIEDQLDSLREELASLTAFISKTGAKQGRKVREQADVSLDDLLEKSEYLMRELQDGYLRGAKEVRTTVRRHPVATIGAAAAFGLVVALLARR